MPFGNDEKLPFFIPADDAVVLGHDNDCDSNDHGYSHPHHRGSRPRPTTTAARKTAAVAAAVAAFLLVAAAVAHSALLLLLSSSPSSSSSSARGAPCADAVAAVPAVLLERRADVSDVVAAIPDGIDAASVDHDEMIARGLRRIATSETEEWWLDDDQILELVRHNIRFMDVTDQDIEPAAGSNGFVAAAQPTAPAFQSIVKPLAANVSIPTMTSWLTEYSTTFTTRYYKTASGAKASDWITDKAKAVASGAKSTVAVTVKQFAHSWGQPSIIARIEAVGTDKSTPIVVLSAHMDSINQANPMTGVSPGADDDGSASVNIFETYRILVATGFVPKRPIEFHWYAAEEGGLLGSQKVVADYVKNGVAVAGVYHMDMTGYQPANKAEVIAVGADYVDPTLTKFLQALVGTYSDVAWKDLTCGYACSDHATWTKAGFPTVFSSEAQFSDISPYYHTKNDDVSHISWSHLAKFSKLCVAFAVEMSLF
ncbi:hypothetical protein DFJ73DRAFT_663618 [Zopfochytrium polystomum]|nr:hypothetical protein DFJ73DRAFT_663618 [Zopfochytrium polystomum]